MEDVVPRRVTEMPAVAQPNFAVDRDDPWLKDYFREERFDSERMCRHRSPDRIGAPV